MASESWYEYVYGIRYEYPNCPPESQKYESMAHRYTQSFSNDMERRVKPKPLYKHLTSMARQYTTIADATLSVATSTSQYWCPDAEGALIVPFVGPSVKKTYSYNMPSHVYPWNYSAHLGNSSDWSLKMRSKIKSDRVNLGVTLAEYRQSCRMFADGARTLKKVWGLYKDAKRGKLLKALNDLKSQKGPGKYRRRRQLLRLLRQNDRLRPKDVAAAHLVNTYGVQPLLSDLYDSIEALRYRLAFNPLVRRYSVGTKASGDASIMNPYYSGTFQRSQRHTFYVEFEPQNSWADEFTVGNPAELLWELLPFSFVYDWLFGIGDYLSSLDALKYTNGLWGSVTTRWTMDCPWNYPEPSSYRTIIKPGRYRVKSVDREVLSAIPLPSLPRYEPSTSLRAVLNGIALLVQLRG